MCITEIEKRLNVKNLDVNDCKKYEGGTLADEVGYALGMLAGYIMSNNRRVDLNHARNGGWQQ